MLISSALVGCCWHPGLRLSSIQLPYIPSLIHTRCTAYPIELPVTPLFHRHSIIPAAYIDEETHKAAELQSQRDAWTASQREFEEAKGVYVVCRCVCQKYWR